MIKIQVALYQFRFKWIYDKGQQGPNKFVKTIRILGGLPEVLRFFQIVQPAIRRKTSIEGRQVKAQSGGHQGFKIKSITPLGNCNRKHRLFDITTETENFIANGLVSHNCYAPTTLHKRPEEFFKSGVPKKDIFSRLRKDCEELSQLDECPEILISFIGDPYQSVEFIYGLIHTTLQILIGYDLPFTILTKGGTRAIKDFGLMERYNKARFGSTIICMDQKIADVWEPGAPTVNDRAEAIKLAHERGIKTWVSLEPVVDPDQAFQVIGFLHRWVDKWMIGKLNRNPEHEAKIDWIEFREKVKELLDAIGADYYLKKSLTEL